MRKLLNYYWRIIATGFCFLCIFLGGFALSITVFPIIQLLPFTPIRKKRLTQRTLNYSFRLFVWWLSFAGIIKTQIIHGERLKGKEGQIIIANHPTLIDVVVLISLLPWVDCVVKDELWQNPFLRRVVSSAGYISNVDPEGLLQECERVLREGNSLLLFPEGTRSIQGKPIRFLRGAANLALRTGRNLIPVTISCVPRTLTKGKKWYQIPRMAVPQMTFRIGDAIEVAPFVRAGEDRSIASRRLTAYLEAYFEKSLESNG